MFNEDNQQIGAGYGPYMDHLTQLMDVNPRLYREFSIMVSTKSPDALVSDYYVGLPNEALAGGIRRVR